MSSPAILGTSDDFVLGCISSFMFYQNVVMTPLTLDEFRSRLIGFMEAEFYDYVLDNCDKLYTLTMRMFDNPR